jgi:CRISPR/Cas system CSM-associated protein Csm3 (group 7 of RAMP superfamily)
MTPLDTTPSAYPIRYVARLTLELTGPAHIGAGHEWRETDSRVVRDANGLPAIPGTTLTGVLRRAFAHGRCGTVERYVRHNDEAGGSWTEQPISEEQDVFGIAATGTLAGAGSRLLVTWGKIHDASDTPVDSPRTEAELAGDPVLKLALAPTVRDHVRINGRGTVDDRGKFDQEVVHAGHRFTFQLELIGTERDGETWLDLLGAFAGPSLRLGRKTRSGFGGLRLIEARSKEYDLSRPEDFAAYAQLDSSLERVPTGWDLLHDGRSAQAETKLSPIASSPTMQISLRLTPLQFWMIGGGTDETVDADSAPVEDDVVRWTAQTATIERRHYLPGSSLKGVLRHRTLFHLYALCDYFATEGSPEETEPSAEQTANRLRAEHLLTHLFGAAKDDPAISNERRRNKTRADGNEAGNVADPSVARSTPGRVWVDDCYLPRTERHRVERRLQNHVHLDPFSGGAADGYLFNELPLDTQGELPRIRVSVAEDCEPTAQAALQMSLDDLVQGRLSVGAHGSRGYGFMQGSHDLTVTTGAASFAPSSPTTGQANA